jgi:hypothetical protein
MHLVRRDTRVVTIDNRRFEFEAGESIHTESSRKYEQRTFLAIAERNGWSLGRIWQDPDRRRARRDQSGKARPGAGKRCAVRGSICSGQAGGRCARQAERPRRIRATVQGRRGSGGRCAASAAAGENGIGKGQGGNAASPGRSVARRG